MLFNLDTFKPQSAKYRFLARRFWEVHLQKLVISSADDEGVQKAARANEASIGLEDGRDMLRALIASGRGWAGMPVAATMWLKVMSHDEGLSARQIGDQLGVSTSRVGRWLRRVGSLGRS